MTKFSFEVPIKHLLDFDEDQDFGFALSFLVNQNKAYADYYNRFALTYQDRKVILDNSYNEKLEADGFSQLSYAIERCFGASHLVAPDSPKFDEAQIASNWVSACLNFRKFKQENVIAVVRSRKMFNFLYDCGAQSFAVSYWTRPEIIKESDAFWISGCHFLGLNNIDEIKTFRPQTCDTSMPIKLAMVGKSIDQWRRDDFPHIYTHELGASGSEFFNASLTDETIKLAKQNIKQLKEECNGEC